MVQALRTSLRYGGLRQGGLQPGLGGDSIFATASLDLNFAANKNVGPLVNHTRASSGTYVGSDGLIKTATTNLLLYSEEFDNAVWNNISGTVTRNANATAAPNGTLTADELVFPSADVGVAQGLTILSGVTYTVSIWIKGTAGQTIRFTANNIPAPLGTPSNVTLTGEWTRYSFTNVSTGTSASLNLSTFGGATARNIYVWGAQLEQSSTVGEYISTTSTINSAPRFDHDPTTGESLGLLVEESRTNEWLGSEDVVGYSTISNCTVASNNAIAPDGTSTADTVTYSTTKLNWSIFYQGLYTGTYTWSGWLKTNDGSTQDVYLSWGNANPAKVHAFTVTGEWQRFSAVVTPNNENVHLGNHQALTPASWNGGVIDVWGTQLEEGSFPTSYIPTVGAGVITPGYTTPAVTRAADVASISGNNFGTFNLLQYSEEFDRSPWNLSTAGGTVTITPNAALAPDGKYTAQRFESSGGSNGIAQVLTLNLLQHTYSIYVKQAGADSDAYVRLSIGSFFFSFNLVTGAFFDVDASFSPPVATQVGNGWWRISGSRTATATANAIRVFGVIGGSPSDVYLWGAQLEQSPVATAYVKSNVTWQSRASRATYYDENGVVRTVPANLLLRSEEFDTPSAWTTNGVLAFGSGSIANAATAPDGTITADKLVETAGGSLHFINQTVAVVAATVYTLSVYVKAAERNRVGLYFGGSGGSSQGIIVNLQNGTFAGNLINAPASYSIAPASNGWYRISITTTATGTAANHSVYICNDSNAFSYSGDGTSGIYLWGAQLEESSTVSEYIPTTTAIASLPRNNAYLPDGNGNFVSAGDVLLEKASTNLLLRSEDLQDTYWTGLNVTRTSGSIANPSGSLTADLIRENSSGGFHELFKSGMGAAGIYTLSVFAKKGPGDRYLNLCISSGPSNTLSLRVNLLTGVASSIYSEGATFSSATSSVTPFANGWYRVALGFTTSSFFAVQLALSPSDIAPTAGSFGLVSYVGDGTSGIYLWGAQLEQSTYPTSYIQTTGTERTRAADVSTSSSGFGNSWYSQSEGTVFVNTRPQDLSSAGFRSIWEIGSDNSNWIALERNASYPQRGTIRSQVAGVQQYSLTPNQTASETWSDDLFANVAFAYKENSFANYSPSNYAAISSGLVPSATELKIGPVKGAHFKRLTYWPVRLENTTLQQITQ